MWLEFLVLVWIVPVFNIIDQHVCGTNHYVHSIALIMIQYDMLSSEGMWTGWHCPKVRSQCFQIPLTRVYSRSGSNIFPWCSRVDSCRQTAFTWPTVLKPTETQKGMCQASYYRNQLGLSTVPYLSRTYTSKIGPPSGHTSPCGHIICKMRNKYTRFLHICQL